MGTLLGSAIDALADARDWLAATLRSNLPEIIWGSPAAPPQRGRDKQSVTAVPGAAVGVDAVAAGYKLLQQDGALGQ